MSVASVLIIGDIGHGKTRLFEELTRTKLPETPNNEKRKTSKGANVGLGSKERAIQSILPDALWDVKSSAMSLHDGSVATICDIPGGLLNFDTIVRTSFHSDVIIATVDSITGVTDTLRRQLNAVRAVGIVSGVIAITRIDLATRGQAETVEHQVSSLAAATGFEYLPEIRISADSGRGINALKRSLLAAIRRTPPRVSSEPPRVIVDRIVDAPTDPNIWGTTAYVRLRSCELLVGDQLQDPSNGAILRISGLTLNGKHIQVAASGSVVLATFDSTKSAEVAGLSVGRELAAANVLCECHDLIFVPNASLDIPVLPPVGATVTLHTGAAPQYGIVRADKTQVGIAPARFEHLQLHSENGMACHHGDRAVLLTNFPSTTVIAGSLHLTSTDLAIARARASSTATKSHSDVADNDLAHIGTDGADNDVTHIGTNGADNDVTHIGTDGADSDTALNELAQIASEGVREAILRALYRAPLGAFRKGLLKPGASEESPKTTAAITALEAAGALVRIGGGLLMHGVWLQVQKQRALYTLTQYHSRFPNRPGMPIRDLQMSLSRDADTHLRSVVTFLERQGTIFVENDLVRAADFQAALNPRQLALLERIEEEYRLCGASGIPMHQIAKLVKAPPSALESLVLKGVERGNLVDIGEGAYWHVDTMDEIQAVIEKYINTHGAISASELRDTLQTNRNAAVAALEYCDRIGFTIRDGDIRKLARDPT